MISYFSRLSSVLFLVQFLRTCGPRVPSAPPHAREGVSADEVARILGWVTAGFAADTARGSNGVARVRLIIPSGPGTFSVKMVGKTPPEGVTETWNYIVRIRRQAGGDLAVDVLSIADNLSGGRDSWDVTLTADGGLVAKWVSRFPEDNPLWGIEAD
jgi:hypothetical protein